MENKRRVLIDMSDYHAAARAYWRTAVMAGLVITAWAVGRVALMDHSAQLTVAGLTLLALVASLKPTQVPGTQVVITPGDVFVFLAAVIQGPAAATFVAVAEASFVSYRNSRRWTSRLGGPALMAVAISVSACLFDLSQSWLRDRGALGNATFLAAVLAFSAVYFLLNSMLLAAHQSLKRRTPFLSHWKANYSWASLTYLASAATAGLVHLAMQQIGIGALLAAAPLIAVSYTTFHLYFKRAEERLEAGERIHLIVNNTSDVIFAFDLDGWITYVNPAIETISGYSATEMANQRFLSIVHPGDRARLSDVWQKLIGGQRCAEGEFRLETKDRRPKWCSGSWGPIHDERGRQIGVQGHLSDITEQKTLQAQLFHSQKMEAIGRLAGGVAHDFNNLLTAIIGYSEISLADLKKGSPAYDRVEQVLRAGERAQSLTRQLLAFSRRQILLPAVLDLNTVVDNVNKLLRRLIGEDTELIVIFSPGLWLVKADPGQIEQVIVNLAVNARDAMPNGGKLVIQTANVRIPESGDPAHPGLKPGDYVMFSVTDSGSGMDAATASRIFEPFFTTKEMGKGTGLGLSTVYGIVKQSGGEITVKTEVGNGAAFKIYLPRVESETNELSHDESGSPANPGTETILVVEDDEILLDLVTYVLTNSGYNALQAPNGTEALSQCERYEGAIHLMITDLVMPRLSGRELADRVASIRPEMKVLFMSGYTDDVLGSNGFSLAGKPFLQKPFTPEQLSTKVREVLDYVGHTRTAGGRSQ